MSDQNLVTIDAEIFGGEIAKAGSSPERINPAMAYLLSLQSDNSRKTMQSFLNRVADVFWGTTWDQAPWETLTRNRIQAIMLKLAEQDLAPSTRKGILSAVKGVMREAWIAKTIDPDEYHAIKDIKGPTGRRVRKGRSIQKEEVKDLIEAVPLKSTELLRVRNRAIIAVMLGSGLRKTEACTLRTDDINLDEAKMVVLGKGDHEDEIDLHTSSIPYLTAWLEIRGEPKEYLFNPINRHGQIADRRISASGMDHILSEAAKEAGVKSFTAHDTRRTFATRLFASGVDSIKVRDAMRHASVETSEIYNMADANALKEAIESVNLLF